MCDDFKQELTNGWEFLDHRQDLCFRLLLLVIPLLSICLSLPHFALPLTLSPLLEGDKLLVFRKRRVRSFYSHRAGESPADPSLLKTILTFKVTRLSKSQDHLAFHSTWSANQQRALCKCEKKGSTNDR